MNTPSVPPPVSVEQLRYVLETVQLQTVTAILLSYATMVSLVIVVAVACNFRKTALLFAIVWGGIMANVHNGYAQAIGPLAILISVCALGYDFFFKPRPAKST